MKPPPETIFYVYGEFDRTVLGEIRRETYGEDLGQFSWLTADELRKFLGRLKLNAKSHVKARAFPVLEPSFLRSVRQIS